MTTIGLSYSLVKISTKCAPALLILAGCSLLATLPAQAADRQDARDVRQEVRPEIREAKIDCRQANNKDNYECRQDKREVKQDVREKSRDVKY